MSDLPQQTIRGYELRELIGAGGFGAVYRAYQAIVGREVAIKIILPQYANQPDFILRFETEAQLVARLEHIHIVPLYDYWRDPTGAYLVMRWLHGGSLRAVLRRGPIPPIETSRLLDQIASALATAHRKGVIHRDLKPDNILLDDEGNAYLADFGIAKDVGSGTNDPNAQEEIIGSPSYLSPEQITGTMVTPRTDIYSLGVMLYELLIGETPFSGLPPGELIGKHLRALLPPLQQRRPDLPLGLDVVIQKATAKSPDQRYPDALSVASAFRSALDIETRAAAPEQATKPAPRADSTPTRQGRPTGVLDDNEPTFTPGSLTGAVTITPQSMPVDKEALTIRGETEVAPVIETATLENPYKGLRAFQQADAADFYGRETLVDQLVHRLHESVEMGRFLAVVGPSGSGKSSVVRAGLLPALRKGLLPGSERWFLVEMIPGGRPFENLEEALLRVAVNPATGLLDQLRQDDHGLLKAVNRILPDNGEMVLVIDQFEEIFTQLDAESDRVLLLNNLLTAVTDPASRLRIIVTLRADFYDRPLLYPDFGNLIRTRTEIVLPLNNTELREAIVGPARRVGVSFDSGLVEAIITDVGEQPGALPLLQYALTELFEHRSGQRLTLDAYRNSGGVLGALARRAEDLYLDLNVSQREAARQLFLRLVTIGEGTEDTRRRVRIADIAPVEGDKQTMDAVIDIFGRHRLLTFDRDPATRAPMVEVAHEALIRTWNRLRGWLAESREDLRMHERLAAAVADWTAGSNDPSFLATGSRLSQFEEWRKQTTLALNEAERAYLDASIRERNVRLEQEQARQAHEQMLERRSRNFLRVLVAVLSVATLGALALTAFALNQQQLAVGNAATAISNASTATVAQGLALNNARTATIAQGQAVGNAATAISNASTATVAQGLAINNASTATNAQGLAIANAATSQFNFLHAESQRLAAEASNVMQASDGNVDLAALLSIRAIQKSYSSQADFALTRATTLNFPVQTFKHSDHIDTVALSPDSHIALTGGADGVMILWDTQTAKPLLRITTTLVQGQGAIFAAVFSPDGRTLAYSSLDPAITLIDVQTGQKIQQLGGEEVNSFVLAFSPDGRYLASDGQNNTVVIWDLAGGNVVRRFSGHTSAMRSIVFSPDGKLLVSGSDDRTARVWDIESGTQRAMFTDPAAAITSVSLSPDGKTAVTGGSATILWNVDNGQKIREFSGNTTGVWILPDGKSLLTTNGIKTVKLLDLETGKELRQFAGHTEVIRNIAVSKDGRLLLTGSYDSTARLWEIVPTQTRIFTGHTSSVIDVTFSPDGKFALSGSGDSTARLWNVATGQEIRQFVGHSRAVQAVEYSPDGKYVLTGGADRTLRLWDVETGQEIRQFTGHTAEIYSVAFSPDGKYVLSGALDKTARLWDVNTGQEIREFLSSGGEVLCVAYSQDGKSIALGNLEGLAEVYDLETGRLATSLQGGTGDVPFILGLAFSPDGKYLATASYDKMVRLWDIATDKTVQTFVGHMDGVTRVRFAPDGKTLVSSGSDKTARLWDVATGQEIRRFSGHTDQVNALAFSPDGKYVLTGSKDHTMRLWDASYHDAISYLCAHLFRDLLPDERSQYGIEGADPTCPSLAPPSIQPTWTPVPVSVTPIAIAQAPRSLSGHADGIWSLGLSSDGMTMMSLGLDKRLLLWDAQTGKVIREINGGAKSDMEAVALSPDARLIAINSADKTLGLWDAQTGQPVRQLDVPSSAINSLMFSPDGAYLLGGGTDRLAHLWDVASGKEIQRFVGHTDSVEAVAFSPDGKIILTGSTDQTARLWEAQTGKLLQTLVGHRDNILSVAFSPDGKKVITAGGASHSGKGEGDCTLRLWDTQTGELIRSYVGHNKQVNAVAYSPDGRYIASGSNDGSVRLWDVERGTEVRRFALGIDIIRTLAFSPDGKTLAVGAFTKPDIMFWDLATLEPGSIALFTPTPVPQVTPGPVTLHAGTWKVQTQAVTNVTFSPDSRYVVSGSYDGSVLLWDAQTMTPIHTFLGLAGAISSDNKYLLLGGLEAQLRDLQIGTGLRLYAGHTADVGAVAFSVDGQFVATGSNDGAVRVWNTQSAQQIQQLNGHQKAIRRLAFSPDGKYLLSTDSGGTLNLWDVQAGKSLASNTGYLAAVFSPDGQSVALGGGSLRVIKVIGNAQPVVFTGHTGDISDIAFSPDGKTIVSGSADKTVRLWDAQTGKELQRIEAPAMVWSVAFSPDGHFIIMGINDGSVEIQEVKSTQ